MKVLALIITLSFGNTLVAQYETECYSLFLEKGIIAFEELDFENALVQFKAAEICEDKPPNNSLDDWINKSINGYLNAIIKANKQADFQLKKANKLIESIYFYDDKYGLAFGKRNDNGKTYRYNSEINGWNEGVYYFIDKNGDEVLKLGRWPKMEKFDINGFAKGIGLDYEVFSYLDPHTYEEVKDTMPYIDFSEEIIIDTLGNVYYTKSTAFEPISAIYKDNLKVDSIFASSYNPLDIRIFVAQNGNLKKIPEVVFKMINLETLKLNSNEIDSIDIDICENKNLIHLDLSSNSIKSVPKEISNFKNLNFLNLRYNSIKNIELEDSLSSLSFLDISGYKGSLDFMDKINFSKIKYLGLSSISLKFVPDESEKGYHISNNNNVETFLAKKLMNYDVIEHLDLSNNGLDTFPLEILNCKNLKYLDISNNNLNKIPSEIAELKKLNKLIIRSNAIENNQCEILKSSIPYCEVINY